ncbi:DUF1134 domain-containing protein [Novosphingobium album (ex Liu et al. 2023)]|uniref:DUF1134 domain-containing protein n=1 Tax=Novosphingobium album (ex Liu et al. 2023) TaxID=3031130 RepID=A0ABT5WSX5_9SPHN|nr:DUF1134 domain-containing protein [Novosphingobium album (ex Liu et al. 2023)]MDE8653139.1 DUF1134 domain-containing protein [Novosphingobium album (ex Liu et al. 2023)]
MLVRKNNSLVAKALALLAAFALSAPALAQVRPVDPDAAAIDGDLSSRTSAPAPVASPAPAPSISVGADPVAGNGTPTESASGVENWQARDLGADGTATTASQQTYRKDDLIGAAEGVFGKGAEGLAGVIEDLLRKQGEPNGYIIGREGSGAIAFGLRYGSGTLHHKVEGTRPVYWTGPSLGFDVGLNAGNAFVLVYNLYDTEDLYHRYAAGEGQAYLVGGFNVSYLRRGDVVLIPVRMGAGVRLGANIGYMKFSHDQKWLPF